MQQTILDQGEDLRSGFEMKRRLGEDRLTSEQRLCYSLPQAQSPAVVFVIAADEGYYETRIRNSLHERENPFRDDTLAGPPRMEPA